jgi:hypothetical protein
LYPARKPNYTQKSIIEKVFSCGWFIDHSL